MNRKVKILFTLVVAFIMPFCVFAKTTITDTKVTNIDIPENWKLITKENINEMMDWLGLDSSKKITYKYNWNKNFYYADIVKDTKDIDIAVIVKKSDIDYEDISIYQYELKDIEKQIKKSYNDKKVSISNYQNSNGIKYYVVSYVDDNNNIIDVLTTIHGNMYIYRLKSSKEIEEDVRTEFMNIANSVEYENYLEFIEKNKIELKEKKDNSSLITIVLFAIIIIVGIVAYILVSKKKINKNVTTQAKVYNPVSTGTKNPSVSDFIEPTQLKNNKENTNPSVADFLNQNNNNKQ